MISWIWVISFLNHLNPSPPKGPVSYSQSLSSILNESTKKTMLHSEKVLWNCNFPITKPVKRYCYHCQRHPFIKIANESQWNLLHLDKHMSRLFRWVECFAPVWVECFRFFLCVFCVDRQKYQQHKTHTNACYVSGELKSLRLYCQTNHQHLCSTVSHIHRVAYSSMYRMA